MQWFDVFLALLCLFGLSAGLVVWGKIPVGFAPLAVLSITALWFSFGGMAGMLLPFAAVWYGLGLLAWAALAVGIARKKAAAWPARLLTPASMFFVLFCLGAVLYLALRRPLLSEWDEFTLWGTAVKLMKLDGVMYTRAETGWDWAATQTPTLFALSYFFQFFGEYAAWKIYAAYAVTMASAISALIGALSFKHYKIAVPLCLAGLLTPWFFSVFAKEFDVKLVWLKSYGDVPAGMLFGGALLCYYGLRQAKAPLWPLFPILAALALVKENTFVFALIAAFIIACDFLLIAEKTPVMVRRKKQSARKLLLPWAPGGYTLGGRLLRCGGFVLVGLMAFLVWNRYVAWVVSLREQAGQTGSTSEGLLSVLMNCLAMLLGFAPRDIQFQTALDKVLSAFYSMTENVYKVSMVGNGLVTTGLIIAIFGLAIALAREPLVRKRCALAFAASTLGFAGYYLQITFSYGRIFPAAMIAGGVDGYGRYMASYYVGWFLLALCCLGMAARRDRPYGFASGATLALCLAMLGLSGYMLPARTNDIGYPSAFYAPFREKEAVAAAVSEVAGRDRVFFVAQDHEMGLKWFHYSYYLLPTLLDYSGVSVNDGGAGGGGGRFVLPYVDSPVTYDLQYTPEEIAAYLVEHSCAYVFVESVDEAFVRDYGVLFADGLAAMEENRHMLYRVEEEGDALRLVPVEVPAFATAGERGGNGA